jgi:stage III sporulation protein SpoIIIAA
MTTTLTPFSLEEISTTTTDAYPEPPLTAHQQRITDNLDELLAVLSPDLRAKVEEYQPLEGLFEIVLDLGRIPEARFAERVVDLGTDSVTEAQIEYTVQRVGAFGKDNRAGIERTLHRISAIRNRSDKVIGLTCRVGRAVYGTIDIIQDVVQAGKSILILGRPGRGKTTKLREMARILSEELRKRVIIVDTSNEIGGDGDIPHPAIGRARRMQVAVPEYQHSVMIEAVENHMPEVIVIDEIGTEQEAFAARTIAERGVQLIGTAHGNTLENLMMNPTLSDLVGGIHAVTLSDDEAKRRGTQKTVLERKAPPTFDVVIEIIEVDKLAIHHHVEKTVDRMLRGLAAQPEVRVRTPEGEIEVISGEGLRNPTIREIIDTNAVVRQGHTVRGERNQEEMPTPERKRTTTLSQTNTQDEPPVSPRPKERKTQSVVRIFPYGVSRSRLDRAVAEHRLQACVARDISEADVVLALKATYQREPGKIREATKRHLPVYVVRSNTYMQIADSVREIFGLTTQEEVTDETLETALVEAQDAIEQVTKTRSATELTPANSYVRRLQHQLVEQAQLLSESVGVEPYRRVRILPSGATA